MQSEPRPLHILLRYSDNLYMVDTIKEHQSLARRFGSVWPGNLGLGSAPRVVELACWTDGHDLHDTTPPGGARIVSQERARTRCPAHHDKRPGRVRVIHPLPGVRTGDRGRLERFSAPIRSGGKRR